MKINVGKTEMKQNSRREGGTISIMTDGRRVEQVNKFRYLGVLITEGEG